VLSCVGWLVAAFLCWLLPAPSLRLCRASDPVGVIVIKLRILLLDLLQAHCVAFLLYNCLSFDLSGWLSDSLPDIIFPREMVLCRTVGFVGIEALLPFVFREREEKRI
jgi:hypothetical protein